APTMNNYRRGQETRFLKETGFLMIKGGRRAPTMNNYRRGQETRFLKETGFLMGRKLTAEPTPTIINY
ncbi:MAG: hypothetical protein P5680_02695, partial [Limnospira sp. PMC 737.11]|uniref:hypothetical protein n=1 Tax=Limnospira sp. PMC 737.11 TaxID=2981095 RepID=UPI0028E15639